MKSTIFIFICSAWLVAYLPAQPLLNGDFEISEVSEYDSVQIPLYWLSSNILCQAQGLCSNTTLTTDAKSGSYALKLETVVDENNKPFTAIAVNRGSIDDYPLKLRGYYKAELRGPDYSSIRVSLFSDKGVVGWGILNIAKGTGFFTPFEMDIHSLSTSTRPDSFIITLYSSFDQATPGTVLIVDNLAYVMKDEVYDHSTDLKTAQIRPNPATDEILVEVPDELGMVSFRIYDEHGQTLEYETFEYQIRIDVSTMTQGVYFYEVRRMENKEIYDKGKFKISRPKL